jgi:hypothetical protein
MDKKRLIKNLATKTKQVETELEEIYILVGEKLNDLKQFNLTMASLAEKEMDE